jgi:hypothetical protein
MSATIQARLDKETRAVLKRLLKRNDLSASEVVRKGIHLVAQEAERGKTIKIIGLGEFDSGIPDLATNKKHLAGIGRSSLPGGKPQRARKTSK